MENLSLIIDLVLVALLAATVLMAVRLSRQLSIMREGQAEMEELVADLATGVERAEAAIQSMKQTAIKEGEALQEQINQARELFNELELMNEVGNSLAERLQVLAERGRKSMLDEKTPQVPQDKVESKRNSKGKVPPKSRTTKSSPKGRSAKSGAQSVDTAEQERARSRAERELLAALARARQESGLTDNET